MTSTKNPKIPGPDHPIEIVPFAGRVTVMSRSRTIADSTRALAMSEASYPVVMYVPLADVDQSALRASATVTYCPYKGDASYYDVLDPEAGGVVADAVWQYREPYAAVGEIIDHVAFYPDRVQIEVQPES